VRRWRTRETVESQHTLVQAPIAHEAPTQEATRRRLWRRGPGAPSQQPPEETLVLGRYRLLERLGTGGFGTVWRAHDELLHREVAVKRIWLGAGGGSIDSDRATREAQATARLSHPAIVALYEAHAIEHAFYLISELVDGQTLAHLITADTLSDEEVLEIGIALADALAHAHARGVIHRDIKPQNVLVPDHVGDARGAAKLTDFGGASLVGEDVLTRTGDVLGTLAYMAPEQAEGAEVAEEADLYSLALVLYEALCGVNPVRGATPAATARRIGSPLESLARRRRDLPADLCRALDIALAPDPEERGTVEELRDALEESLDGELERPTRRMFRRGRARAEDESRAEVVGEPATRRQGVEPLLRPRLAPRPSEHGAIEPELHPAELSPARGPRLALPRALWIAGAIAAIVWQVSAGRSGVALLVLAALAPLLVLPGEHGSARVGAGWLACALAPVLGLAGLAGAFPAIAGQASRWHDRFLRGALGYWWLLLAEPLLDRRLWLGLAHGTPPRSVWEASIGSTATHVIAPEISLGVLCGALLWACGSLVLPWIARGRNAALDVIAVVVWSTLIVAAAPALDAGLTGGSSHPDPRGAVLGAILGGLIAVSARALRGPV
jgi:eukaryotic-like serine/threonine-protein kinase